MKWRTDVFLASVLLLVFAAILFSIHFFVGLYEDDWHLANLSRQTFNGIIAAEKYLYLNWSGRIPVNGMIMLLLNGGIIFWRIVNPLVVVALLFAIVKIVRSPSATSSPKVFDLLLVAALFMTTGIYILRESVFWLTGSITYLWPLMALITFLVPLMHYLYQINSTHSKIFQWLYALLGFFIGWSNEQCSGLALFLLLAFAFACLHYRLPIPKWFYAGMIGVVNGYLLLITAPGNFVRLADPAFDQLKQVSRLTYFKGRMITTGAQLFTNDSLKLFYAALFSVSIFIFWKKYKSGAVRWFYVIAFVAGILSFAQPNSFYWDNLVIFYHQLTGNYSGNPDAVVWKSFLISMVIVLRVVLLLILLRYAYHKFLSRQPLLLFAITGAVVAQLLMLLAPYTPERTLLASVPFLIIAILSLLHEIKLTGPQSKWIYSVIFVVSIACFIPVWKGYYDNHLILSRNIKAINAAIAYSNNEIHLQQLNDERYGLILPYMESKYEKKFRIYYHIPDSAVITWHKQ